MYNIPIAVAYKKRWGNKVWLKIFKDLKNPDKIIAPKSKLLPEGSNIVEIGVGKIFIERYKKKYKIK
tara:strand:+ start:35 stop:235 length:201 start_codon:yes stop_codon:yes gene_type:complete